MPMKNSAPLDCPVATAVVHNTGVKMTSVMDLGGGGVKNTAAMEFLAILVLIGLDYSMIRMF
jgi:hypothetical protein